MEKFLILILISITIYSKTLKADELFKRITFYEVMNDNIIYDITQDKKGVLWIASYKGLYKFNGYNFIHFNNNINDKYSILTGPVRKLFLDKNDNLWLAISEVGIQYMNIKDEKFHQIKNLSKKKIELNSINDIKEDKKGNIWFATEDFGLFAWDRKNQKLTNFSVQSTKLPSNFINAICCTKEGKLYFSVKEHGLFYFDDINKKIIPFILENIGPDPVITSINESSNGDIWLGSYLNVGFINNANKKYNIVIGTRHFSTLKANIGSPPILIDKLGEVWLATQNNGLYKYGKDGLSHYNLLVSNNNNKNSNILRILFEDNAHNIWIGTDNGLTKLNSSQRIINTITDFSTNKDKPRANSIRSIYEDNKNNIWAGSVGDGLFKFSKFKAKNFLFNIDLNQYSFNYANVICPSRNSNLLIGTVLGLQEFDPQISKFTNSYFYNKNIPGYRGFACNIWSILEINEDTLLLGTKDSGLVFLNRKTGNYKLYRNELLQNKLGKTLSIWSIHQSKDGRIWLGSSEGLKLLTINNNKFNVKNYNYGINNPSSLLGKNIFCIYEDKHKNLWLATSDGGLSSFNTLTEKFYNYANTFPVNTVSGILEDDNGYFWISSLEGIFKFDPKIKAILRQYTQTDGLQSNHFNFGCCFKDKNGTLYFGGSNGIDYFRPDDFKLNILNPNIIITSFKALYEEKIGSLLQGSAINLEYKNNSFSVECASLDLTSPEKNQFSYLLEGLNTNWIPAGTRNYINYTNLSPGKYTLKIRGTNCDGIWSKNILRLKINIDPPFWLTWWFYCIVFIFVASILFYNIKNFIDRNEAKRKHLKSELNALRAQLNPHFVFNSLTSLQHFIIINEQKLALEYLSKFAKLMRNILDNSQNEFITLHNEIEFLKLYIYMESVRINNKVDFSIEVADDLNVATLLFPSMMLQPLVENALIHGLVYKKDNGKIIVRFFKKNKMLYSQVEDNGIGRKKAEMNRTGISAEKTSMGMKIIEERLKLLNQGKIINTTIEITDLVNDKNEPMGTKITIITPYITSEKNA